MEFAPVIDVITALGVIVALMVGVLALLQAPPIKRLLHRTFRDPFHKSVRGAVDDSKLATAFDELDTYTRYHLGPNGTAPALFSRVMAVEWASENQQEKQRLFLDEVDAAIMEADTDQRTIFVNRPCCEIFGAEDWELTGPNRFDEPGRGWEKFIHPDDLPQLNDKYDAAHTAGAKAEWEGIRVINSDGSLRCTFNSAAYPVKAADGRMVGYIGVLTVVEDFRGDKTPPKQEDS